jgi:hypothetical protein
MIKSRRMKWARHNAHMGAMRNSYKILAGKNERKRPFGRRRLGWVDNIKVTY